MTLHKTILFLIFMLPLNLLLGNELSVKIISAYRDGIKYSVKELPLKFTLLNKNQKLSVFVENISKIGISIMKNPYSISINHINREGVKVTGGGSMIPIVDVKLLDHIVLSEKKKYSIAQIELPTDDTVSLICKASFGYLDPITGKYIKYTLNIEKKGKNKEKQNG